MGFLDHMMANIYKPPKQEKPTQALPKNLTPARAAKLAAQTTTVTQGQVLKGEVLDLRANQIQVLLENGATVSARTEGTLNLSIGQHARFLVALTTEDQILLKLTEEDKPTENPMIDKALTAANIIRTERSVSIVTELLAHKQPVTESNIRHFLSLSAKNPELPVKDLILMELHNIPTTKENIEQFSNYRDRNARLLTQAQDMLKGLTDMIDKLPEGTEKQSALQELAKLLGIPLKTNPINPAHTSAPQVPNTAQPSASENVSPAREPLFPSEANNTVTNEHSYPADTKVREVSAQDTLQVFQENPAAASQQTSFTGQATAATLENSAALVRPLPEHSAPLSSKALLKDFLDSFLLQPEELSDPERVQEYYEELNEKINRMELLSEQLSETTKEAGTTSPKQMRQNLSFMEAVNQIFPFVQLPLKFRENPAHGELYVYEKKRSLKPSDTLSALLHLELEALGTTDIFVTLSGHHVTTRFSMTDKEAGTLVRTEMPSLTRALAAKGYTLQSEVTVREPLDEATPTLLEQFLEEQAPGGLNRYTFDIRA